MVEFALILPLFLLLIFGMIEFGFIFFNMQVLTNAAREGARYGIVAKTTRFTAEQITAQVNAYCGTSLISFSDNSRKPPTTTVINRTTSGLTACSAGSKWPDNPEDLQVQVSYDYRFLVFPDIANNLFDGTFNGTLTLTKSITMKCE